VYVFFFGSETLTWNQAAALTPKDHHRPHSGTGFPPFRGGLLQYADSRGAKNIVDRLNQLATKLKDDRFKPAALLEEHAKNNTRFFPNRPVAPYAERKGFPDVKYW
jgi:3-hydroxyacyl-CoA dehydrogenase/enoyl-CoA hydratase/3-hydroxybutyryl-CoA epimerase